MAFTISEFRDLIQLLAEHPEWRSELRRHVLSDELLDLPNAVSRLVDAQAESSRRLEAVEGRLAGVEDRLAGVEDRLTRIETQISLLTLAIDRLTDAQGVTDTRLGHMDGLLLEERYARRGQSYFSRMARRLRRIDTGALADLLDEAADRGDLTDEERDSVLRADVVFSGRRRSDDVEVYVLIEVSAGIRLPDVERALERSRLLAALGRPVMPLVGGYRIDSESAERAFESGVWQALDTLIIPPRAA